jgi:hypothetical protein
MVSTFPSESLEKSKRFLLLNASDDANGMIHCFATNRFLFFVKSVLPLIFGYTRPIHYCFSALSQVIQLGCQTALIK